MTNATIATLKSKIETVVNEPGGSLITMSQEALNQMAAITTHMVKVTGFSMDKVSAEDLAAAEVFCSMLTKENITGRVENGLLLACSEEEYEQAIDGISNGKEFLDHGVVLSVVLLEEVVREAGHFYR